jgi:hypothetical protein
MANHQAPSFVTTLLSPLVCRKFSILSTLHPGEGFVFWQPEVSSLRSQVCKEGRRQGKKFATKALQIDGITIGALVCRVDGWEGAPSFKGPRKKVSGSDLPAGRMCA